MSSATFRAHTERAHDLPQPGDDRTTTGTTGSPAAGSSAAGSSATGSSSTGRSATNNPWVVRGSLAVLLVAVGFLYIWGLGASGYANSFYSAAAQAGSQSWKAFFFGSLDAANAITVDKPPASLWFMALSVRIFGLSSWSILVPEALMGVASVATIYATIRRVLAHGSGLPGSVGVRRAHWAAIGGATAFALTPAATLMFRFNNPDALLVLLMCLASYCTVRAIEKARTRWLVGAGVLIGFGFLTKMLQAFLVLPALVVAYAIAAPTTWWRKVRQLFTAFVAMLLSLGWYVAIVELVPASWRPYIGGSQNNSMLELVFGYNGLGRITGNETGSVTGGGMRGGAAGAGATGGAGGGMWGQTGITRLFDSVSGGMIAWLIPAALILAGVAVAYTFTRVNKVATAAVAEDSAERVAGPAAMQRAGLAIFAGWLIVTGLVFSFMAGIYHDYYTVALAPAIGGTLGIATAVLWTHRRSLGARIGMFAALAVTATWTAVLAQRATGIYVTLGWVAAGVMALAGIAILVNGLLPHRVASGALVVATLGALTMPAAYSVNTAATAHQGSIVTAGPVSGGGPGGRGGPGGMRRDGRTDGAGGQPPNGMPGGAPGTGTQPGTNGQAGQMGQGGQGGPMGQGGQAGQGGPMGQGGQAGQGGPMGQGGQGGQGGPGGDGGGPGGLMGGATVSAETKAAMLTDADSFTWVAAAIGSQTAASYQLSTGYPVMAIGGFNGSDPAPTLEQFQQLVAQGQIHYFIAGGGMGGQQNGGSNASQEINTWVSEHFTQTTLGSAGAYDLTQPLS